MFNLEKIADLVSHREHQMNEDHFYISMAYVCVIVRKKIILFDCVLFVLTPGLW